MIAATFGRTFLKAYNQKYKKEMTARQFFEEEYWPLFYNSSKYMQWINNSPFDQISKRKLHSDVHYRKAALSELIEKIEVRKIKDMSTVIGAPASDKKEYAVSSGLVTDIDLRIDDEDAYLSWIASGLCLGVGMYSILYADVDILLDTYEGWKVYRGLLDDDGLNKLKGNQINSWNGLWLNFKYSKYFSEDFDYVQLQNNGFFEEKQNFVELTKIKWSELMFNISSKTKRDTIIGYIHNVGDVNKTIGFYQFNFDSAKTLISYYTKLFGGQPKLFGVKRYETIFGDTITKACQKGVIGLQALEPKDLRSYFGNSKNLKLLKPKVNPQKDETEEAFKERKDKAFKKDYENIIYYQTYKTWLLAMITKNKEESLEYTKEVAEALHAYRKRATKTDRINLIQGDLLVAKSKKAFINALVKIVEDTKQDIVKHDLDDSVLDIYKNLRDRVHLMNAEDFGYFVVLLKFDFAYVERDLNQ